MDNNSGTNHHMQITELYLPDVEGRDTFVQGQLHVSRNFRILKHSPTKEATQNITTPSKRQEKQVFQCETLLGFILQIRKPILSKCQCGGLVVSGGTGKNSNLGSLFLQPEAFPIFDQCPVPCLFLLPISGREVKKTLHSAESIACKCVT